MIKIKYVGSKNKISKELAPIIQSYITEDTKGYYEVFVGGANMIDKIKCKKKIGSDVHKELIALLKILQTDIELPKTITEEEYKKVKDNKSEYEDWYVGLIGFCGSYNGKYFDGYAGTTKTKEGYRHYDQESIRNIEKQRPNLKGIKFINANFLDIPKEKIKGYVIYCDPPYQGTTKYKTDKFPYDEFWDWCREMSKDNTVLISEYNAPDDFKCIWQKDVKTTLDKNSRGTRIEKLFIYDK